MKNEKGTREGCSGRGRNISKKRKKKEKKKRKKNAGEEKKRVGGDYIAMGRESGQGPSGNATIKMKRKNAFFLLFIFFINWTIGVGCIVLF